jgi:hypothetical protein
VQRQSPAIRYRRRSGVLPALLAALFTVAASFHHHDIPELRGIGIAADNQAAVSAPLHDCVACRVSHGVVTLDAAVPLPGRAPAPSTTIRLASVPVTSPATATPSSPRAPPPASLIRL